MFRWCFASGEVCFRVAKGDFPVSLKLKLGQNRFDEFACTHSTVPSKRAHTVSNTQIIDSTYTEAILNAVLIHCYRCCHCHCRCCCWCWRCYRKVLLDHCLCNGSLQKRSFFLFIVCLSEREGVLHWVCTGTTSWPRLKFDKIESKL